MDADGNVDAVDISNWQEGDSTPEGLSAALAQFSPVPSLVIVRAGLSNEPPRLRQIAIAQMQAALALGKDVGLYVWGYAARDPAECVQEACDQAAQAGVEQIVLMAEDLEDTPAPDGDWSLGFIVAVEEHPAVLIAPVYTGEPWWKQHMAGETRFAGKPLWTANYNGRPDLTVPSYGGMVVIGHQWTDFPLDRSVFDPAAWG